MTLEAATAPTERSKPPTAMLIVTPTARIATTDTACSTLMKLLTPRKAGSAVENTTIITARSRNTA